VTTKTSKAFDLLLNLSWKKTTGTGRFFGGNISCGNQTSLLSIIETLTAAADCYILLSMGSAQGLARARMASWPRAVL
jgi:hypothetical protein